jgi:hypothetical protein
MYIRDSASNFFTPSCITEETLFAYTCNGTTIRHSDGRVQKSKTTFTDNFQVHVDEYIKRKGLWC